MGSNPEVEELEQVTEPETTPSEKKPAVISLGKKAVTGILVAAVVIVAGIGMWVWHEQPSFCAAICHTPMDKYAETYFADPQSEDATLVATHAQAGKDCLSCHPAELSSQIKEGTHWITGDYAFDQETGKLVSRSGEFGTQEGCMTESCHLFTEEDLRNKTSYMEWNPHDFTEHGVTNCGDCHKMHDTSVYVCTECHYQAAENVPEGWDSIPYREKK
ncbi:MAG: cytochrome c3 family protein [Coriobacteriia bacterium]|nr:cytochrome c3 family protein [Coriobacteriia bacterium]